MDPSPSSSADLSRPPSAFGPPPTPRQVLLDGGPVRSPELADHQPDVSGVIGSA